MSLFSQNSRKPYFLLSVPLITGDSFPPWLFIYHMEDTSYEYVYSTFLYYDFFCLNLVTGGDHSEFHMQQDDSEQVQSLFPIISRISERISYTWARKIHT